MPLRNFNNNQSFIPQEDPDDKLKRIAGMTEYDDWKFAHDRGSIPDSAASVMFVRHGQDISYSSPTMLKDNIRVSYPRSYWNNPQRVARMHEVIDNAPSDWKAPEWLDVEGIENLYRYYEYKNPGKSWEDWNNLSVDDPGIDLANYLDQPPQEYMSNIDQDPAYKQYRVVQDLIDKYNEAQAQIKKAQDAQNQLAIPALQQTYSEQLQAKWSALEPWQQFLMARDSTTPMEGRPEWTYATAAAWSGLKTGWSTYGMAMLAMGAIGAAGGSFAPGIGTAIGAAVGLGVGAYSAYTALNNKENGIAKILNVFNIPAEYTEKIIGVTAIALSQDGKYKFPESMDAKTLLEAGKGAYESQIIPVGNWEANAISWFAHLLNPEWSSGQIAHTSAGEVWKIEQGIVTPQVVRGGQLAGEALFQSAIRLNRGEDPTIVYEDMIQNFGYSGTRADFLMQNLLDPAQTIPWIVTKAGGSIAGNIGDSYLRDALAAKQGHLAIDMLPMGWQQIIEGLATKVNPDWHGTGNIFGALQDYRLRLRTSYTPVSGDYIPATDYNKFQMFFGGLTKNNLGEVVVKNLEPYVPDPDKGKIANLAYYLGENTSEAKAVMYSANFTSALERVMAYAGGDPNTFIDMLKSSVSGDDKAFQELAGHYLSSPEMVSIRGGLNDFLNNEKTKTYISIWNATAPKRILLENLAIAASAEDHISIAQVLEMLKTQETSEQLFRWISENPNTENRIVRMVQARIDPNTPNLKASDRITIEGLQERMDKFINGDIVYHPDAMMAKLRNSLEDSIKDHLVDRYGLKADGFVSRLASLNKAVQSTLLLGLSPSYFANNFVDGMVNLAYNGAYGLMSPGHVAKLWEDMGIPMPSRINEGFGPGSVVASIYDDLNPNDLLSQLHKVVGWGNNKLGIFTALSDKVEKLQGATATTAGFMQYMRGNWKEGVGFGKLPADLEASIRQAGGDPNKLYRLVEQAKTPDEIRDIFAKEILAATRSVRVVLADGTLVSRTQLETIARVHQAVETVGQEIYGDNSAELLSDLIVKTGLDDTIVDNIRQGSTEQEAINNAVTELREAVNNQVTNDIISRIQTDEALISTEGSRIAINILNEMKANYMSRHALLRTQEFTQTADVYELRNKKLFSQADTYYDTFVKNSQGEIRILGEDYIIRLATVLRTLDPDSAVHQPMINALLTQKNIWDTFYKTKNDMQNEFRMTKHEDYEADRDKLIADITRLELKARTDETTQQDIIDHGYLRMLGTNDETRAYVQNWLSKNREMTNTLIEKDRAFFESIAELRKTDPRAAAAAFVKYNIDTYTPYVAKMLEANEAAQAGYDDAAASAQRNREIDAQRGVATEQPVEPARPTEPIELTTRKAATEAQDTKLKRSLTIDEARQYLYDAETRVKIKAVEDALYDGIKRAFPGSSDAALRSSLDLFRMKADVWAVNNKTTPLDFWKPYTSIENAETMQPPDALAKMILENNSKYGPALNEKDTKVAIDQFLSEAVRARGAVAAGFMAETKRLFPGIKKEQYQFVDSYIDMMANAYAKKYNKTPDDYYKDVWASRKLVNDDTKDPISRAMMKYNREGSGLPPTALAERVPDAYKDLLPKDEATWRSLGAPAALDWATWDFLNDKPGTKMTIAMNQENGELTPFYHGTKGRYLGWTEAQRPTDEAAEYLLFGPGALYLTDSEDVAHSYTDNSSLPTIRLVRPADYPARIDSNLKEISQSVLKYYRRYTPAFVETISIDASNVKELAAELAAENKRVPLPDEIEERHKLNTDLSAKSIDINKFHSIVSRYKQQDPDGLYYYYIDRNPAMLDADDGLGWNRVIVFKLSEEPILNVDELTADREFTSKGLDEIKSDNSPNRNLENSGAVSEYLDELFTAYTNRGTISSLGSMQNIENADAYKLLNLSDDGISFRYYEDDPDFDWTEPRSIGFKSYWTDPLSISSESLFEPFVSLDVRQIKLRSELADYYDKKGHEVEQILNMDSHIKELYSEIVDMYEHTTVEVVPPATREELIYKFYVSMHNPFDIDTEATDDLIWNVVRAVHEIVPDKDLGFYTNREALIEDLVANKYNKDLVDEVKKYIRAAWSDDSDYRYKDNGISISKYRLWTYIYQLINSKATTNKLLEQLGFDGIKHVGGIYVGNGNRHNVLIPFHAEQIKSVRNAGEFDPQNPNIYHEQDPFAFGNKKARGLVTFDQYGKALLRTTEIADIKTFLHENWHVMSRVMLDPEDIDYIADHYSKGTMTGADFTLNRAKLANGQSLDPEVAKLLNQMEEDLVNDCETLWTKKGADIAPSRLVQLVRKIQQFFKDMYKSLTQRNLDDNPQLEAVLKKIIFPTGEEDPDVKPATHEPVPPDKGQILAATLFKQGKDYRQAIIRGTKAADMQSFIHEMLHTTLYTLRPNELDTLAKYAGFEDGQEYLLYRELRDFNSLDDNPEMAAKLKTGEDKLINEAIDAIGNNKLDSYPASIRNVFVKIKNSLLAIWHKINQQQPETQWSEDISKAFHSWILGSERDLQAYQMAVDAGMKAKAIATGTAQGPIDLALGNGQTYPTRYTAINLDELKEPFVPINYNSDVKSLAERVERVKIEANEDLILSGFPDVYQEQGDYPVPNYKQAENRLKTLKAELDALGPRPTMTDDVMAFYRRLLTETETIKKNYDDNKTAYPPKLQKQLDTIAQLTADYEKIQNWDAKAAEVMNAEAEYTTLKAKVDTKLSDPDWINRYKNYKDLVVEMSRVTSKYNAIKEGRNQLEIEKVRNMVPKEWFNSNGTQQAINNDDLMILIHPDGRVMYDPNGVRKLLRPYQNPVKNLVFVDKGEPDLSTIGGVILRDYGLTEAQARDTYNRLKSGELTPAQVDKYYYDAGAHDFAINEYHDFKLKNMTRFGLTQEQVDDPNIVVALMPELDYETLAKTSNPGNIYDLWNISATSRTPLVLKPLINNLTEYAKTPEGQTPIANAYISEIATTMEYLPFRDVDGKTKAIIHPTASANDIIEAINAERMAPLINSLPGVLDIIEYATLNSWNSDMIYKLVTDTVSQKVEKFEKFTLKNATTGDTYSAATMQNFIAAIDQTIHAQLENSASLGKYDIHGPNINEAVRMPMSEMPDNIKYHINNSLKYFLSNTEYLIANPTPTKLIISDKPIVEPFYKNAKELSANIADGRVKLSDVQTALIDILANNYNKDNPLQQQLLRLAILDKVNTPEVSYYYRVAPYDIITKRIDQVNGRLDTLTRRLSMGIRNGLSPEAFQNEVKHIEDTIKEYQNGLTIAKEQYELINNKPTQAELTSINKNNLTDAQRQQLSRIKDTTSSDLTKAMNLKKEIARLTAGLEANKALLQSYKDTGTETEPLFYKRNVTELSEEYHRVENLYKDSKELGGLLTGYQKQTIKALLETLKARIDSIRSQRDIYDTDNGKIKTKSKLTADAKLTAARRQAALAQTELEEQTKIQSDAAKNEVMSLAREAVAAGYEGGYKPKMLNSMLDANNYKNKLTEFLKLTINLKENTGDNPFGDLFYKEDQVPDLMRAGITHNLYRLLNEIEKYNANKQDPAYLPPVIRRNMILLATDDIDIRQKDLKSGQKRGIDIIEDVTKRLIDKGVRNLTPYNLLELELLGAEYIAVAETPWHKKSNDPAQRQAIEEFISTFAADDIDYKPSNVATQTVGQRAGVTPVPLETGRANQELLDTHVLPIMDNLKAKLAQDKTDYNTDYVKALTPKEREQLSSWINRTATQLTDTKYNAREWGVMQRDYALLNYKNRTNLDTYMDLIFPYQFWFTRNARNWAMKSLSKPGLIAQVVRREEMMRKNGKDLGKYPKRLQGKMRLPWAFGEDWMGDAIYFNPFKNLFPPNNLMSVFDNLNQYSASVNPIYVLKEQVSNHEITQEEMDEALNKKSGKIWDKALKIAAEQNREELSNPITMASMMLSPSMILSEAFGTKPKDNLPITKTGIAVRSFGKRVGGVLEPVSDILAKALEAPERLLRGNNFSYYGHWGDYIIKRAIASKVADHSASYEEGITAMATMKGTTYEDATRRVEAELSMKLPGSSLANTLADQAWTNIPQALITTMFPTGLYPKGEMDLMGLTEQMQAAWDEYGKGNPFPIDDLLQKHPELLVKSGINDEPELLMKKLLINNIREKYDALDSINKGIIKQQLGDAFVESLLSGKIDYDNITKEDLLIWTDAFGEQLPEGEQIPVTSKLPGVETFTDDQVAEISGYLDIREQRYPNHAWLQQNYAAITDPIEKKKYLAKFPELTHYWDWNKEYKHAHPIIDQWSAYYGNAGTAYQDPYFGLNKNIIQGYLDKKAELFPNITWQQEVYFNLITDEEKYAFLDANPDLAKAWDWDAKMEASNPNIKMYKQLREAQFAMYQSQPETETGEEHTPAEQSRRLSLLGLHPYVVQELLIYKANKTPYSSGTKSVLERLYVAMGKPTETLEEFINSLY